jgi:hypothetical protein
MSAEIHGDVTPGQIDDALIDDTYQVGFGYINNRMGGIGDARATLLTAAVRSCLRD